MQRTVKRDYWLISGLLFFFFFSWSSSYSLFSIWLHQVIGLNGTQTGYVFAANAIAAEAAAAPRPPPCQAVKR